VARTAYAELVASVEKELAKQLSDSEPEELATARSRSPSVQSRACSEPEPVSDWLLLDDNVRGYSSECEARWADVADDSEDETMQQRNQLRVQWQTGAGSLDSRPVVVPQNNVDSSEFVPSSENHVVCGSVSEDAFLLNSDGLNSGNSSNLPLMQS